MKFFCEYFGENTDFIFQIRDFECYWREDANPFQISAIILFLNDMIITIEDVHLLIFLLQGVGLKQSINFFHEMHAKNERNLVQIACYYLHFRGIFVVIKKS